MPLTSQTMALTSHFFLIVSPLAFASAQVPGSRATGVGICTGQQTDWADRCEYAKQLCIDSRSADHPVCSPLAEAAPYTWKGQAKSGCCAHANRDVGMYCSRAPHKSDMRGHRQRSASGMPHHLVT